MPLMNKNYDDDDDEEGGGGRGDPTENQDQRMYT